MTTGRRLFRVWVALAFTWAIAVAGLMFFVLGGAPGIYATTHTQPEQPPIAMTKPMTFDEFFAKTTDTAKDAPPFRRPPPGSSAARWSRPGGS
jgi:hypothetical protein